MSASDLDFIIGEEKHISLINDLFHSIYETKLDEEHIKWRYFSNPHGAATISLAYDTEANRLAGCYMTLPAMLQLGRDQIKGAHSVDTMVHPDYQGQGLFTGLAAHCFETLGNQGYAAAYGFPNSSSYPGFVNRLNWHHVGDVPRYRRPVRGIGCLYQPTPSLQTNRAEATAPTEAALDQFLAKHPEEKRVCRIARSGAWLLWRYHPLNIRKMKADASQAYHWQCIYNAKNELVAFGVWSVFDHFGSAAICELHGIDEASSNAVLQLMVSDAIKHKSSSLTTYCSTPSLQGLLRKNGFLPLRKKHRIPLIVRNLTAKSPGGNIHQPDAWQVISGDMDTQ